MENQKQQLPLQGEILIKIKAGKDFIWVQLWYLEWENYVQNKNKRLSYITQTTLSVDDTVEIIQTLKRKFPDIKEPKKDDICYATTNRQLAVKKIAKKCEMFFVIGSYYYSVWKPKISYSLPFSKKFRI